MPLHSFCEFKIVQKYYSMIKIIASTMLIQIQFVKAMAVLKVFYCRWAFLLYLLSVSAAGMPLSLGLPT